LARTHSKVLLYTMAGQLHIELKTAKLPILLRVPDECDAEALLHILSNPRNTEFDPHAGSSNLELAKISSMIARMRTSAAMVIPDRVNLVVVDTSEAQKVIGLGGFGHIGTEDGKRIGDVGIMLDPQARGKGYALEAMKLSIDYAFNVLRLDMVTATMLEKNLPMRTLLDKKLGLVGTRRDGEFGSEFIYSISHEDWANPM
jgi:RimJ/RimL family protein N-acetyltransferase